MRPGERERKRFNRKPEKDKFLFKFTEVSASGSK